MAGWRGVGLNLLTSLIALAVTLAALELVMRATLSPSRLVGSLPTRPELNQWYHELRFWERYHDRPEAVGRHDPLLGWDSDYSASRIRDARVPGPAEGLRAVAVGDSFVFGNEVEAHENFAALLDGEANGLQVLNMGVPGYGIDQSYLKYVHHGSRQHPDVVLFGIYVGDYERSSIAFTTFAKPRFVATDTGPEVRNQPVPAPAAELERISGALAGRSYLLELLSHVPARLQRDAATAAYLASTDRVVLALLRDLRQRLTDRQRLLVIQFPRGESFTDPDPLLQEVQRHLLKVYADAGVEVLDLDSAFRELAPLEEIAARYYVRRADGAIGHLSVEGHRQTARLISSRLGLPWQG